METISSYQLPNRRGWYFTSPHGAQVGPFFSQLEADAFRLRMVRG